MNEWNSGYVTDISYTANQHPDAAPHRVILATLLTGFATDLPDRAEGVNMLELGCGRGIDALLVAAGNPGWQVTAVDFMPGHIAEARTLARETGIENITYIEADLSNFAETDIARALPMFDVVTMHGVWSWVPEVVRAGIVRLLATKVQPGGLVHVSYNALPGLQGALAFQRMIYEAGRSITGRSDAQAAAGIALARELVAAEARHLDQKAVHDMLEVLEKVPVEYISHEYMNAAWHPCFQIDVASAMAPAKLEFVGVTRLLDNFRELTLSEPQLALFKRHADNPRVAQLISDTCTASTFRHDVYVRGARRLTVSEQYDALCRRTVALTVIPEKFVYKLDVMAGQATLNRAYYEPIVNALAEGPRKVGELLQIGGMAPGEGNPAELIGILVGTGQAVYLPYPQAEPGARIARVNAVLARRMVRAGTLANQGPMASARTGAGFPSRLAELFLVERLNAAGGAIDPGVWAAELNPGMAEEEHKLLTGALGEALRERFALWRHAGAL